MKKLIISGLCVVASLHLLQGQCCSGGVPISSNLGLTSKSKGTFQLQLTYDYNTLRDLLAGNERLNDDSRVRNTHSALLELAYDFHPAFSISTLFTWVRQERFITGFNDQINETINMGLGDAIVLFRYNVFHKKENRTNDLLIGIGPKLPLGKNDHTGDSGLLLPADLQPGTGSWDIVLWSFFTQNQILRPTTQLTAFATYRYTNSSPRPNSNQVYEFGNELQVQVGISDRFTLGTLFIDPSIAIRFRNQSEDLVDNQTFPNSGANYIFLTPSINLSLGPSAGFRIAGNLPLYREISGTQLATSYRISATVFFSFSKPDNDFNLLK